MATEVLNTTDAPGNNIYFVLLNSACLVFDFADNTFKLLSAPPTTPYVAATEKTTGGGVNESRYVANLDLAHVNNTPAIGVYTVEAYRRLGGSPAIATDICLGSQEIRIAAGSLVVSGSPGDIAPGYVVRLGFNVTSTEGDEVQLYAWVERFGQPVTLDAGDECTFDLFEHTSGISAFGGPTTAVNPSTINQFEDVVDGLELNDDVEYLLKATVTVGGVTLTGQDSFPVIGSA